MCFVSDEPRDHPFDASETVFAELGARVLEHELEREPTEAELARRATLITALNRVLRHNLRNDLAVIRGHVATDADSIDNETGGAAAVIDSIDDRIDLSEKARSLESIIETEATRRDIEMAAMVERIVSDVGEEYPRVSITVEEPDDVTVLVRPSIEIAPCELIENAAKHSGEQDRSPSP